MSATTTILALVLYPLLNSLPLNLVRFRWGLRQGFAPMPPDVKERAEAADRTSYLGICVTLLTVVVLLMRSSSISAHVVGITASNWASAIALGAILSFVPVSLVQALPQNLSPKKLREDMESRGPLAEWIGLRAVCSFSTEFWRAFCIVALIGLGLPAWIAVLIAAVAYGVSDLSISTARAAGAASFGGVAGLLFVKTGSLLAPLTMSLIVAGFSLYRARHIPSQKTINLAPLKCPVCSQPIARAHYSVWALYLCPGCGAELKIFLDSDWVGMAVLCSSSCAIVALYLLGLDFIWCFLLVLPVLISFSVLLTSAVARFLPRLLTIEVYQDPHDPNARKLFRF